MSDVKISPVNFWGLLKKFKNGFFTEADYFYVKQLIRQLVVVIFDQQINKKQRCFFKKTWHYHIVVKQYRDSLKTIKLFVHLFLNNNYYIYENTYDPTKPSTYMYLYTGILNHQINAAAEVCNKVCLNHILDVNIQCTYLNVRNKSHLWRSWINMWQNQVSFAVHISMHMEI